MISAIIVGVAVVLVVVVVVSREGCRARRFLRWSAAAGMLVAVVLQEVEVALGDLVLADLARRLVFLVTQASVVSLVMTFRQVPFARRSYQGVWVLAGVVGVVECVLVAVMPFHADGVLYAYTEASRSVAVFGYYALYEATIAATAIACSVGSVSVLLRGRRIAVSRVSLVLLTLAAAFTVAYVAIGWFSLLEDPGFDHLGARHTLFLVVISLLVGGLATEGVRGVTTTRNRVRGR